MHGANIDTVPIRMFYFVKVGKTQSSVEAESVWILFYLLKV